MCLGLGLGLASTGSMPGEYEPSIAAIQSPNMAIHAATARKESKMELTNRNSIWKRANKREPYASSESG
jgi:hypothetical protein